MNVEAVKYLEEAARQEIRQAQTPEELELLRVKYLGRKGELTLVLRGLKDLDPERRRQVGQEANRAKVALEEALAQALAALKTAARRAAATAIDVSLPGRLFEVFNRLNVHLIFPVGKSMAGAASAPPLPLHFHP